MIAHVAGMPVEELLLPALAGGTGTWLLLARAWLGARAPAAPRDRSATSGTEQPS